MSRIGTTKRRLKLHLERSISDVFTGWTSERIYAESYGFNLSGNLEPTTLLNFDFLVSFLVLTKAQWRLKVRSFPIQLMEKSFIPA